MRDLDWLAERFESNRTHLRSVAYRMLGSKTEAEDAVQEAWLRLSRADTSNVSNLGGWLTTVVARVCLDMLRSRESRREESLDVQVGESAARASSESDAEQDVMLADSVGLALLVVLETLAPAERVAFVLHDMFDLPFEEIATIVGRSPAAARQLASRARRRVQGQTTVQSPDRSRQREIVDAFLAASRGGDFEALLAVLDPDVVVRADRVAVEMGATEEVRGARAVAETFFNRARAARPALVDGEIGLVWAHAGKPRVVIGFHIREGRIIGIDLVAEPDRLEEMAVEMLEP
jgi:RNA polymerase sigma factor (sigma-70 family)